MGASAIMQKIPVLFRRRNICELKLNRKYMEHTMRFYNEIL
jgi:hypothetical protein